MTVSSIARDTILGVVVPGAIVVAGWLVMSGLGVATPEQKAPPGKDRASQLALLPEARVAQVRSFEEAKTDLDLEITGTVVPFREISIASEVSGRIVYKDSNCRPGRYVTAGQLLFRIDPKDYELEVARLGKMREQDYAALKELDQELTNLQRLLDVSDEEIKLTEAEIERLESLPDGIASESEMDTAKRNRLASLNQRITFENQVELARTRRARLEAAEQLASTQLEKAKLDLARCEVRSPVNGVIVSEQAETDSFVQRGSALVSIEDTQNVEVSCSLRMDQLYWILDQGGLREEAKTDELRAERYALPQTPVTIQFRVTGRDQQVYQWEGNLSRYQGSGIDPQSRTVPCRVRVEKPYQYKINGKEHEEEGSKGPPALVRGMFVDVIVHTKPSTKLLLVPKLAVKPGNIIWKFVPDEGVIRAVAKQEPVNADAPSNDAMAAAVTDAQKINPDQWDTGRLIILDNVQLIRTQAVIDPKDASRKEDYWVVETREDQLVPGQTVVVTPLASVRGDGSDVLRVAKLNSGESKVIASEASPKDESISSTGTKTEG